MAEQDQPAVGETATGTDKQLMFQKIYVKDVSFESPNAPSIFSGNWQPQVNLNMTTTTNDLGSNRYEVVLNVTIDAKQDGKTAFLTEIQQAAIFELQGFTDEERTRLLGGYCPGVVFPYAREAVSDLVGKGGFPQLLLQPVNFDALFAKHVQDLQRAQSEAAESGDRH